MKKVWKICKYQKLFVTLQACFVDKTDKAEKAAAKAAKEVEKAAKRKK